MVAGARGIGAAHTARGQIYESVPGPVLSLSASPHCQAKSEETGS
jgi:hypothetical protein